jgi:adenylyltransferase/sulfurtransferase
MVLHEIGGTGQMQLCEAQVVIIGAGGIGCPAIQYLAAAGIGGLTVIDDDTVSLSNLQRQILYGEEQIGMAKVAAAEAAAARINPDVAFRGLARRITPDDDDAAWEDLLKGADVIIDGSDNFQTRLLVSDQSVRRKIPLVSAAIGKFQGQIGSFFGWETDSPCYRCFVGDAHDPDDCDDCATVGVLGPVVGLIGTWAAMEAVRVITGFGDDPRGKLHLFDGLSPAMRTMRLPKDPACKGCCAG